MIAVDTNLLVYAHREDAEFHVEALRCVHTLAEGAAPWAIPWPCVHEFFAIVTHPRIYAPPTPPARAIDQIEAWLESPSLALLAESPGHWPALKALLDSARVRGPLVHDARIAALCLQHGVSTLWTADRDFARFAPLRTANPLIERRVKRPVHDRDTPIARIAPWEEADPSLKVHPTAGAQKPQKVPRRHR